VTACVSAAELAAAAGVTIEDIANSHIRKEDVIAKVLTERGDHPGLVHVPALHKGPHQPRPVVVWQLAVQIDHFPAQLRAVRTDDPNTLAHRNP